MADPESPRPKGNLESPLRVRLLKSIQHKKTKDFEKVEQRRRRAASKPRKVLLLVVNNQTSEESFLQSVFTFAWDLLMFLWFSIASWLKFA